MYCTPHFASATSPLSQTLSAAGGRIFDLCLLCRGMESVVVKVGLEMLSIVFINEHTIFFHQADFATYIVTTATDTNQTFGKDDERS